MEWLATLLRAFAQPFQWWIVIAPWEQGLRVRIGKIAAELGPGIHFRIPFFDRIYVQSIRLRTIMRSNQTVSSFDGHPLALSFSIDFAITNLREMFDTLSSPEATLQVCAAAAIAEFIVERSKGDIHAAAVEAHATEALASFGKGLGSIRIRIVDFAFVRTYRLLMNDGSIGAGLWHGFDSEHDGGTGGPR